VEATSDLRADKCRLHSGGCFWSDEADICPVL